MDNCPTSFTLHPGIIEYKGHAYYTYHTGDLEGGGGFTRSGAIEEFKFGSDGSIPHINPTREGPDQIEYFNPYKPNEAETICFEKGIKTVRGENGIYVTKAGKDDYIKVAGVNFAEKATGFTASACAVRADGTINIRLDSPDGDIVGSVTLPEGEEDEAFKTVSCDIISGVSGVHDLYFTFDVSVNRGYVNFDTWQFDGIYSEDDFAASPAQIKSSNGTVIFIVATAVVAVALVLTAVVLIRRKNAEK